MNINILCLPLKNIYSHSGQLTTVFINKVPGSKRLTICKKLYYHRVCCGLMLVFMYQKLLKMFYFKTGILLSGVVANYPIGVKNDFLGAIYDCPMEVEMCYCGG